MSIENAIELHLYRPWMVDYKETLIAPARKGVDLKFFQPDIIGYFKNIPFYKPSDFFWETHVKVSHPPNGKGCDASVHNSFLTPTGDNAEFLYLIVYNDDTAELANEEIFHDECKEWKKYI